MLFKGSSAELRTFRIPDEVIALSVLADSYHSSRLLFNCSCELLGPANAEGLFCLTNRELLKIRSGKNPEASVKEKQLDY